MLNPTQTQGLDALNKKITAGYKPNPTDTANLNFAKGQGYKSPVNQDNVPMITGYKDGVPVQVPKGAYVPGVSLVPKTVKAEAFDVTKDTKYQELLKQNEDLSAKNKLSTDATAAGTAAGADEYSKGLNSLASEIKANIQTTFTPEQQKANVTGLLDTQAKERTLKENFQAGVDLTGTQAGVPMSDVRGQQAVIQNQYNRQAGVLSDQEANLLSAVNLSSQERQALVNGEINISNIQDKVQSHIDSAKKDVLDQAKTLTADAQTNLASALDSLKGTTWSQLSPEQQNSLYTLAQQGGYPVSVLQAGMDAVAKQTTLDNNIKQTQADAGNWAVDTTTGLMYNKKTGEVKYTTTPEGTPTSGATVVSDATGNSYDISSYATDPNHEKAVSSLVSNIGQFKSVSDIDNYIKSVAPNSPITGQMIADASSKYGVSWEVMTAMMQQDSSLGTAGKGAKTFNPGNVGNTDSGATKNYGNWQSGVDAVAQWLGKHKTDSNVAPQQTDILSQSGLGILAYNYLTQGVSSLTRLNAVDRKKAMKEAEDFVKSKGIDYETFQSQYKTYNDVLSQNMKRFNNTKIMENEVLGTLDNLSTAISDADLNNLKIENVGKIMAGQQINDPQAMKVVFHTQQLRNEMAGYFAATQGKTSPDVIDNQDAAEAIKNGLSTGSVSGLKQAVENSTVKMGAVLQNSVDYTQNQVRGLFNVKPIEKPQPITENKQSSSIQVVDDYINSLPEVSKSTQKDSWFNNILKSIGIK